MINMPSNSETDNGNIIKIDTNPQENNPKMQSDLQHFILDMSPLKISLYEAFCGWLQTTDTANADFFGCKPKEQKIYWQVNKSSRKLNEIGANYIYNAILGLISPTAQTSNLSQSQIYRLWRGRLNALAIELLNSYLHEGNPYEIKDISTIRGIIATIASFYTITNKAKKGFVLKELAETFVSTFIAKTAPPPEKKGLIETFKGLKGD